MSNKTLFYIFCIGMLLCNMARTEADNISSLHSANSFLVAPGANLSIPIKKVFVVWQHIPQLHAMQPDWEGTITANLLWQDTESLIKTIRISGTGENATIQVETNNLTPNGNAVIVLKTGNTIRWSWHLWVTDYKPEEDNIKVENSDENIVLMKQNLGYKNEQNTGTLYQFGRSTPFTNSTQQLSETNYTRTSQPIYDIDNKLLPEGNPTGTTGFNSIQTSPIKNLAEAIQNPLNFYFSSDANHFDWAGTEIGLDTLWLSENGEKGIFDPSPEGWRLPRMEEYEFLENHADSILSKFPRTGSRDYSNGKLFMSGVYGMYWSANVAGNFGYYTFVSDQFTTTTSSHYRSNAYAVRCVRDESWTAGIQRPESVTFTAFSKNGRVVVNGLPESEVSNLQLFNTQGKLIAQKQAISQTTIGASLPQGIYILRTKKSNRSLKVVVY